MPIEQMPTEIPSAHLIANQIGKTICRQIAEEFANHARHSAFSTIAYAAMAKIVATTMAALTDHLDADDQAKWMESVFEDIRQMVLGTTHTKKD